MVTTGVRDDLFKLPQRVHRHAIISHSYIRFEDDEFDIRVLFAELKKGGTE